MSKADIDQSAQKNQIVISVSWPGESFRKAVDVQPSTLTLAKDLAPEDRAKVIDLFSDFSHFLLEILHQDSTGPIGLEWFEWNHIDVGRREDRHQP